MTNFIFLFKCLSSPFLCGSEKEFQVKEQINKKFLCCPLSCKEFAVWHYWALYYLNWKQDWELHLDNKTTTLREERNQWRISDLTGKESKHGKDQVPILPSTTLGKRVFRKGKYSKLFRTNKTKFSMENTVCLTLCFINAPDQVLLSLT